MHLSNAQIQECKDHRTFIVNFYSISILLLEQVQTSMRITLSNTMMVLLPCCGMPLHINEILVHDVHNDYHTDISLVEWKFCKQLSLFEHIFDELTILGCSLCLTHETMLKGKRESCFHSYRSQELSILPIGIRQIKHTASFSYSLTMQIKLPWFMLIERAHMEEHCSKLRPEGCISEHPFLLTNTSCTQQSCSIAFSLPYTEWVNISFISFYQLSLLAIAILFRLP